MFMQVAIGAIGIGVILMIGYIVVSQVRSALPTASTIQENNPCFGQVGDTTPTGDCEYNVSVASSWAAPSVCGDTNLSGSNDTAIITCDNLGYATGTSAVQVTVFAGFALIAVGIIVLAAFGLIQVFR